MWKATQQAWLPAVNKAGSLTPKTTMEMYSLLGACKGCGEEISLKRIFKVLGSQTDSKQAASAMGKAEHLGGINVHPADFIVILTPLFNERGEIGLHTAIYSNDSNAQKVALGHATSHYWKMLDRVSIDKVVSIGRSVTTRDETLLNWKQ